MNRLAALVAKAPLKSRGGSQGRVLLPSAAKRSSRPLVSSLSRRNYVSRSSAPSSAWGMGQVDRPSSIRRETAGLQSRSSNEVISTISQHLKKGNQTGALNLYEEVFRPHIYHQLERGKVGGSGVMGLEQWKLPVDVTRQLLRCAKDTARYALAEEFFALLSNSEAVIAQDVATMLSVYAMTSQTKEGEALFNDIIHRSPDSPNYIKPNVYLYNGMLKLYKGSKETSKARSTWAQMIHLAVLSNSASPMLLSDYHTLFPGQNSTTGRGTQHSILSDESDAQSSILDSADPLASLSEDDDILSGLTSSRSTRFRLNAASFAMAFSAGAVQPDEFSPILDALIASSSSKRPSLLSAISFSAFMSAVPTNLVKSLEPRLTTARRLIGTIQITNYVAILSAYAHAGMRRQTEEIEEEMMEARLAQSPSTVTTLLALYTRLHLVEHQKRFMSKIRTKNPDLHSMTTIMNALTHQGQSGTALSFFREFQKNNTFVDIVAYNSAMNAAAAATSPTHVLELMQEARDRGLTLDVTSFAMLQSAYARASDLEGFRSSMVKLRNELGVNPDARSWTAYLQLLKRLNAPAFDIEQGIHSMLSCGYAPNSTTLIPLLQHLERRGEVKTLLRIEDLAKSGALGPEAKKTIAQNRSQMPMGPLLKQALAHAKGSSSQGDSL